MKKNASLTKACPFCSEEINFKAIKCKHCGEFLPSITSSITHKSSKKNSPLVIILWIIFIILIMCAGMYFFLNWLYSDYQTESTDTQEEDNSEIIYNDGVLCDQVEFDYLRENGCILYENYKNNYLLFDQLCNSDYTCKGSASQKQGYETFKTWDSFYTSYCENKSKSIVCSEVDFNYLRDNDCRLYENYKDTYLNMDGLCNANYSCRGSASQKEGYEAFKSWADFESKYCNQ